LISPSEKFVNEVAPDNLSTARRDGHGFRVHEDVLPSLDERLTTFSPSYLFGHVEVKENVVLLLSDAALLLPPLSRAVLQDDAKCEDVGEKGGRG